MSWSWDKPQLDVEGIDRSKKNNDLFIENLDFTFPEVEEMEGIPWYKTSKEWKEQKEAEKNKKMGMQNNG